MFIRVWRTSATLGLLTVTTTCALAQETPKNTLFIGPAGVRFHASSSDLQGPAGTTPPGVKMDIANTQTLALSYQRDLGSGFSAGFQLGLPPVLRFRADGTAAALGDIGKARVWIPAVVVNHHFEGWGAIRPYVGLGINRTSFTDGQTFANYTAAFSGSASQPAIRSSWGPVVNLGVDMELGHGYVASLSYSRYGIRSKATITTETPGVGPIARNITVRSDPSVISLMVGKRF